ncbi:MAG: glycosyltransferase [Verrucomicrobiota bacterium]|nr:glycosyltransferase [Verrucomicrobiota bacterium]
MSTPPPCETHEQSSSDVRYAKWIAEHEPAEDSRRRIPAAAEAPTISLLVPVHHTPARFLDEMIASVVQQTDPNWELCIVGAHFEETAAQEVLERWLTAEPRIHYEAVARNLGIANNTNRALQLAVGEFIGLLDHDDLLAPFAVHELREAIHAYPRADIFYSDEDRWSESGRRHSPFFKPEWSPELLFSCMYVGHLSAYRRSLGEELGGLRAEFDLSQDYDFALRATEKAREVRHIPHVLYHWREHAASGSAGGKPEARTSNVAALRAAAERRGLAADVIAYPSANRVRMRANRVPRVSIIVPSDSAERTRACAVDLPRATSYPEFEIVIVTNSELIGALEANGDRAPNLRTVRYDRPFNFSRKCNAGADAATGEIVIFLNDDVSPMQTDWIENLIEPLELCGVGAVAPKMIYADGRLQHAGLVTGVRGLIGTAFHLLPHDSPEHVNFAQSMRDVSALSGACLALRRVQFLELGGFDATQFPVFHSDVDLCFKLRETNLRCVYTPFVSMRHLGHASLGAEENNDVARSDKSDVFLLKHWAGYVARDPYFPPNMRNWLYRDSPEPLQIFGNNCAAPETSSRDVLFVCADLDRSEETASFLKRAIEAKQRGDFAVIATAAGNLSKECLAAGLVLMVDPLIASIDEVARKLGRGFDEIVLDPVGCEKLEQIFREEGVELKMISGVDKREKALA